jgi:hypothetical protein
MAVCAGDLGGLSVRRRYVSPVLAGATALCLLSGAWTEASAQGMPIAQPPVLQPPPSAPQPQPAVPAPTTPAQPQDAPVLAPVVSTSAYRVQRDAWSDADERGYSEFITALGNAPCRTTDQCLKSSANPFARTDRPGVYFASDCADLPYFLRAYYAWKRGLPFSYISAVSPRGRTSDIRYTASGNDIASRRDITTGSINGLDLLVNLRNTISSAMYRLHPDMEGTDLYPIRLDRKALRPGSVLYDPNGHLAVVYRIEDDGRILYMDAHPDNSLTRGTYGRKFVRSSPGMGSGFKNWRPRVCQRRKRPGTFSAAGRVCHQRGIARYSTEQFFGNAPSADRNGRAAPSCSKASGRLLRLYARETGRGSLT